MRDSKPAALPPVSETAVGVAAVRAAETARLDRLFSDPLAAAFLSASGRTFGSEPPPGPARARRVGLVNWVVIRTRFLDDVVIDATASGCRQAVIFGAGLDARAFRLDWPAGARLFELDLPDVLEFKERVIGTGGFRPRCQRIVVPVDLAAGWTEALEHAGFDPAVPTVWLAEGLLAYLTRATNEQLLDGTARLSQPGSRLGLTLASQHRLETWTAAHPNGPANDRDYVALWQSAGPDQAAAWLADHGWRAEVFSARERSAAYGRPLGGDINEPGQARLVDARR
jgi:methyltransferase (TIGR00027 family)